MADVAGVLSHRRDSETIVAADDDLHSALPHLMISAAGRFELSRQAYFLDDVARHADPIAFIDGVVNEAEGRSDEDAVLDDFEHIERLFVGEVAMIDAIDPIAHGPLHRGRRASMAGNALVPFVRDFDSGCDLDLAHRGDLGARRGNELVA